MSMIHMEKKHAFPSAFTPNKPGHRLSWQLCEAVSEEPAHLTHVLWETQKLTIPTLPKKMRRC